MFLLSFSRAVKFAIQGIFRNSWLSIITILSIVFMLFSLNLLWSVNELSKSAISTLKEKIDISVYFKPTVKEIDIKKAQRELAKSGNVKSVEFVSSYEAQRRYREIYKDRPEWLEPLSILSDNPFASYLIIKSQSVEDYQVIMKTLDNEPYAALIEEKNFSDNEKFINILDRIFNNIEKFVIIITIFLAIIVGLLIFNTIRMTIYTHSEEIGIMKLVGASSLFVRFQFILESIIYSIGGVFAGTILFYLFLHFVGSYFRQYFEAINLININLPIYFLEHVGSLLIYEFVIIIVITTIASSIAITRYLKV